MLAYPIVSFIPSDCVVHSIEEVRNRSIAHEQDN